MSIALCGNAAEIYPELLRRGVIPDLVTEQTSAHDPLTGYIPNGFTLEEAAELRAEDPEGYVARAKASMAEEVEAMLGFQAAGAEVFDYGNNIRAGAKEAGAEKAYDIVGFVPKYIRPLFCVGKGPFRWVALSGDPADIAVDRRRRPRGRPRRPRPRALDPARARAGAVPGAPVAHLLARLRRRARRSAACSTTSCAPAR